MDNPFDENFSDEEEFHSTMESPSSHGDLGPPALLAFHLVLACVALHKRTKSHHGTGLPPPPYPLGVPHFPVKKKGRKSGLLPVEIVNDGNVKRGRGAPEDGLSSLQHKYGATKDGLSSNGFLELSQTKNVEGLPVRSQSIPMEGSFARAQEQPWNAPTSEKLVIKSSTSPTHVESFPVPRRTSWAQSINEHPGNEHHEQDGFESVPVKMSMDNNLDRGFLNEFQSKRRDVKREVDSAYDGEGSICTSDLCKDGETSLSVGGQPAFGSDEEGLITCGGRRITDTASSTIRELPEDYGEASRISMRSPSLFPLAHTQRRRLPFLDDEGEERENRQNGKQKQKVGKNIESCGTDIRSGDGSSSSDRKSLKSSNLEGSAPDQMSEAGQLESLLLWPAGLAVEAIAFQVRLVAQAFALIVLLFRWCNSFTSNRVRETLQAKERATEALSHKMAVISNVPPKVTESGSLFLKRAAWGCLAATYVCFLLSILLFPALFMDAVFLSKIVEEPVSVKQQLHFDYTLQYPAAVVSVHPPEKLRNAMGKVRSHQEHARAIPNAHKVHVTVILTLPESDYNRNLGMFQLSAELLSTNGESIKVSSRPCMLRFHSAPIRMLKTFLVSLPSMVGGFPESQTLEVHLMEFEEQPLTPTSSVRISMQPKAGLPLGHGIPEIYSADVYIDSHLPWLKNMIRNWKWTLYIWMGLMLYVMEIVLLLCCCRHALLPQTWMRTNKEEEKAKQDGGTPHVAVRESSSLENKLSRRHRQRSLNELIPTARAMVDQRERKSRPSEWHASLTT